jgi:hypothetical protein
MPLIIPHKDRLIRDNAPFAVGFYHPEFWTIFFFLLQTHVAVADVIYACRSKTPAAAHEALRDRGWKLHHGENEALLCPSRTGEKSSS